MADKLKLVALLGLSFLIGFVALMSWQRAETSSQLKVLFSLKPFELTASNGQAFPSEQLKGKVWVTNFMFTSCTQECPLMAVEMLKIQQKFEDSPHVKLVSFTVDPKVDTPEILAKYAQQVQAKPDKWFFLTGAQKSLFDICVNSFKLPVQERKMSHEHHHDHGTGAQNASSPFLHSQKFVLVDQNMQVRGYYDSDDAQDMAQLLEQDLPSLLR